ncbi:hypothetical protein [Alteriqipengyuania sp. 357]
MKILFIGLDYHRYTKAISAEFEALGHEVTFYDIFKRSAYHKSLRLISLDLQRKAYDRYHRDIILREAGTAYDMVLFLQCHQVSDENLELARKTFPQARFVLYNWDSLHTHDYASKVRFFDTAFTFDRQDAIDLDIEYLPLFGLRDFQDVPLREQSDPQIYFVGNIVNPTRYLAIDEFRTYCAQHGIAFEAFMAVRPPVVPKLLKVARPRGVSLRPIAPSRFAAMVRNASATFDYGNHRQTGLTMRTIENLCARRKIVTTNARVCDHWFYSPDRILVVETGDYDAVAPFLETSLAEPDRAFEEFHIQTFARFLLSPRGHARDGSRPDMP